MTNSMDCVRLIELVEKCPELYDSTHQDYGKVHVKRRIWDEISKELNESPIECKTKWACLRSSYVRDIRLQDPSMNSKSKKKKKKWYLADYISFLKDHVQQKSTKSKAQINESDTHTLSLLEEDSRKTETLESHDESKRHFPEFAEQSPSQSVAHSIAKFPRLSVNEAMDVQQAVISCPQPMISIPTETVQPCSSSVPEDNQLTFFRSLLPDIHQLSQRRVRKFKADILQLLNNYLDQEEADRFAAKSIKSTEDL